MCQKTNVVPVASVTPECLSQDCLVHTHTKLVIPNAGAKEKAGGAIEAVHQHLSIDASFNSLSSSLFLSGEIRSPIILHSVLFAKPVYPSLSLGIYVSVFRRVV